MIRAVLDTNTLVSALLVGGGFPSHVLRAAYAGSFACFASAAIVDEVFRTLSRDRIRRKYRVDAEQVERLRFLLESVLVPVAPESVVPGIATHPEDDQILATAVAAQADYLVTGDRQLLALGEHEGVQIVSPRQFLDILTSEPSP